MTNDIADRFDVLDHVSPPELWAEALRRSTLVPESPELDAARINPDPEVVDLRSRNRRRWSTGAVLAATAVVATFLVISGGGELVHPDPAPSGSAPPTSAPAPISTVASGPTSSAVPPTTPETTPTPALTPIQGPVTNPVWGVTNPPQQFPGIAQQPTIDRPTEDQWILDGATQTVHPGRADSVPLGAGCTPGNGVLADGIWAAGIVGADRTTLTVDVVCIYPQQAEMFTAPDGGSCDGPFDSGDPCMTNRATTTRTLKLQNEVAIAIPFRVRPPSSPSPGDYVSNAALAPATVDQLLRYLAVGTDDPFWVQIEHGAVTRVEEFHNNW